MTAADEGWAKHVADILRRNDIRLFARDNAEIGPLTAESR